MQISAMGCTKIFLTLYRCIVSGSFQLEPLLRLLADEFRRRDMRDHLRLLRAFYVDHRARTRAANREKLPPWTEDNVIEWLMTFRIPPFEYAMPVLGRGAACPGCGKYEGQRYVVGVRPGGRTCECKACGARWLEEED
jgi:hypothetical protein